MKTSELNFYRCVSEALLNCGLDYYEPPESYCIYVIIEAKNRNSAIWKAWKTDKSSFTGDARDCPKFSCRKLNIQDHNDFMEIYESIPYYFVSEFTEQETI